MTDILFLASGGGGNFKFLYHAIEALQLPYRIVGLISDRMCAANEFAEQNNIFTKAIKYNKQRTEELDEIISNTQPHIVITNIHKILAPTTLLAAPGAMFINLHYSLLPAYAGMINMEPVNAAKAVNNRFIGVSSHDVIEEVDAGKIIAQAVFQPEWDADIVTIYDTVFKSGALTLLNAILLKTEQKKSTAITITINNYEVTLSESIFDTDKLNNSLFWSKISSKK